MKYFARAVVVAKLIDTGALPDDYGTQIRRAIESRGRVISGQCHATAPITLVMFVEMEVAKRDRHLAHDELFFLVEESPFVDSIEWVGNVEITLHDKDEQHAEHSTGQSRTD